MSLDSTFRVVELRGSWEDQAFAYGRACAEVLAESRAEAYIAAMTRVHGRQRDDVGSMAQAWVLRLPEHFQAQIAAMAEGARAPHERVAVWLYADIATSSLGVQGGPMCSSILWRARGSVWVARNCDWYPQTLMRGTNAVVHRHAPGSSRIASVALGITGDLDCDTGCNAAGLWLHMHTLLAHDEPRAGVSCISWLFWMREALETCATIDEVEAFIARTDRDRGVILFAADAKSAEVTIFECSRSSARRIDPGSPDAAYGDGRWMVATNHCQSRHPSPDEWARRPAGLGRGSTVWRCQRLREVMRDAPPEHLPEDLMEVLADADVEMRDAEKLRTIYSCVAELREGRVETWFASGAVPAASAGTWRPLGRLL